MTEQSPDFSTPLHELMEEVRGTKKVISAQRGKQLHSPKIKARIKALVQMYFRVTRVSLVRLGVDVSEADSTMQQLLELANKAGAISRYRTLIRALEVSLQQLELHSEIHQSDVALTHESRPSLTSVEQRVLETLGNLIPSTASSYKQILRDLEEPERFSYRGTATELREVLRETLDHLAPDKDVEAGEGFRFEKDRTRPTMTQKARYILRSRGQPKNSTEVPSKSIDVVDQTVSSMVRSTYDRGSIDTHTQSGISRPGVVQLKMYVDSVLCELLEIHRAS